MLCYIVSYYMMIEYSILYHIIVYYILCNLVLLVVRQRSGVSRWDSQPSSTCQWRCKKRYSTDKLRQLRLRRLHGSATHLQRTIFTGTERRESERGGDGERESKGEFGKQPNQKEIKAGAAEAAEHYYYDYHSNCYYQY